MIKEVKVRIKGTCDYLQNKRTVEAEITEKAGEPDYSESWKQKMYRDEETGCFIPSKQLRALLVKSASNFRIGGKGRKTFKDLANATLELKEDKVPLQKRKPDYIHQEFGKIQRNSVLINRPAFKNGWIVEFTIMILSEAISTTKLREILEFGGNFVGIGDWRPHYGRFEICDFEEIGTK